MKAAVCSNWDVPSGGSRISYWSQARPGSFISAFKRMSRFSSKASTRQKSTASPTAADEDSDAVALLKAARDESAAYVSGGAGDEDGLGHWPHRQQGLGDSEMGAHYSQRRIATHDRLKASGKLESNYRMY